MGASLGTVGGEMIGGAASVAGIGYVGYRLGSNFGPIGSVAGAAIGAGGALLLERKIPLGQTAGAAAGFLVGGIAGGAVGAGIGLFNKVASAF